MQKKICTFFSSKCITKENLYIFVESNKQKNRNMKAIIENKVEGDQSFVNRLVHVINHAKTIDELKKSMKSMFGLFYESDSFIYGFGGSHMWISNKSNKQRIIFVEL